MTEKTIRVGTVGVPVRKKSLLGKVDVIEIADTFNSVPKSQAARKRRADTPDHISYTVQLPKQLFTPPRGAGPLPGDPTQYGEFQSTEENLALFARALRFAEGVQADTLVLVTPPDFTPAKPRREALRSLLEKVDRGGKTLVWQPSGPWEAEAAAAFAAELGAVLAVDPLRDPPPAGPACYLRLGPFAAMGSRMGVYDLEQIAAIVGVFENATVVFETERSLDDAAGLKRVLDEGVFDDDELDEFDDDLEDDFDDE